MLLVLAALGAVVALAPSRIPPYVEDRIADWLEEYGLNGRARLQFEYCWRNGPGVEGTLRVALDDAPWKLRADFAASCSEWTVKVLMKETAFSEQDPAVSNLLARYLPTSISNLTFSGSVALEASAERTFAMPVPVWHVRVPLSGVNATFCSGTVPMAISNLAVTATADGIAAHYDLKPFAIRAGSLASGTVATTDLRANVQVTERGVFLTDATMRCCDGQASVYALRLDPKTLNAGFTLLLDGLDAGEALKRLRGFEGEATGRLHGKVRLFVREGGKSIRLREAFLYSIPGETGKLRMTNPRMVTDHLAMAGLNQATRANVADALGDLDYTVLRLDITRDEGTEATVSTHIAGTATRGATTVPVDIAVNIRGEIEQLINTGLDYASKLKGKKK